MVKNKPLIQQGWLRALVFCIVYFLVVGFIAIPVALFVDSVKGDVKTDLATLMTGEYVWVTVLAAAILWD